MALIDLNLPTASWLSSSPVLQLSPQGLVDRLAQVGPALQAAAASGGNWTFSGASAAVDFANNSHLWYGGLTLANPAATSGTVFATTESFSAPVPGQGHISFVQTGQFQAQYSLVNGVLNIGSVTGVTTSFKLGTTDPARSVWLTGGLDLHADGSTSGTLSQIKVRNEFPGYTAVMDGSFTLTANPAAGITAQTLAGTLAAYSANFDDGSYAYVRDAAMTVRPGQTLFDTVFNPANFGGNDTITLRMAAGGDSSLVLDAGAGDDIITVQQAIGKIVAGAGNDVITIGTPMPVDGGGGIDTLRLGGNHGEYTLQHQGDTQGDAQGDTIVLGRPNAFTHVLSGVERIAFDDLSYAFDIDGHAGQAYRLYQAAFNRQPDLGGQGYYIKALDGGMALLDIARNFLASPEFAQTYGSNAADADFITAMYRNALHREPDAGGAAYYADALQHGLSRAQMLINFSESPENQAQVIGAIEAGIAYTA